MNAKQWVAGTIVGGIVVYVLGPAIWGYLFADFFAANVGSATGVSRDANINWAVGVGSLAYAGLMVFALAQRGGALTIANAIKVCAIVGFLLWLTVDFIHYGTNNVSNLTAAIADPLLELVRAGIVGAVLGVLLPKLAEGPRATS